MKKIFYLLCCISLLCSSCNRTSECQKVIEKLQLNENGFCGISLREEAASIASTLGNVDPANYSHMFSSKLKEIRNFNGVNALLVASFPCIYLADEECGAWYYVCAYELMLAIPCDEYYNESLVGKRLELYDAVCEYYRQEFSPILEDKDETTTFFHIRVPSKASSLITPNTVVVQQDEENNCVTILINDNEDSYDEWKSGEL